MVPGSTCISTQGGWKCGYITCTILRCLGIWYDRNVNNIPSLACHCTCEIARLSLLVEVERQSYQYLNVEIYTPTLFQIFQWSVLKIIIQRHTPSSLACVEKIGEPGDEAMKRYRNTAIVVFYYYESHPH